MVDDIEASLQAVLVGLRERPPMSEQEFHYRLEPLRSRREPAVRMLLAGLADERDYAVAAASLHELATAEDAETLLEAFRDPARPPSARAEIAQVLAGVAGDRLNAMLRPDELVQVSALSLETFLGRLRDRAGLAQIVDLYRYSSVEDRRSLITALDGATRPPDATARLGTALDPLFPHETEPSLRELMIHRLAERPEPASARALGRWIGETHGLERRRIREALRQLGRRGIAAPSREGALEAWMSGADGTGCYNVGISFPGPLGLRDVLLACLSLEAGLRATSLIQAVEHDTIAEIHASLEQGQGIPVASLDPGSAFRRIHEARARTLSLGRPLPPGSETAARYLDRPVALAAAGPTTPPEEKALDGMTEVLVDLPAYATWAFVPAEVDPEMAGRVVDLLAEETPDGADASPLGELAREALQRLIGPEPRDRLVAMLRHQHGVHAARGEPSMAAAVAAAAAEIEAHGLAESPVARRMMERSLRALASPGGTAARPEVREGFKRRIENAAPPRRREVLALNLAEALLRRIEDLNERLPPTRRLTFEELERIALGVGELAADEFTRDSLAQAALPGLEHHEVVAPDRVRRRLRALSTRTALVRSIGALVARESELPPELQRRMTLAMTTVATWFGEEMCLRQCRKGCLTEPGADGRELFYGPPAVTMDDEAATSPSLAAPGVAALRHLCRRIEDSVRQAAAFGDALAALVPENAARFPMEETMRRLQRLRRELDRRKADAASIYSCVDEVQSAEDELTGLARRLATTALRAVSSRERSQASADYPAALAARRRFRRLLRELSLHEIEPADVEAALGRLESTAPLLALLRLTVAPRSASRIRALADRVDELWTHTPREQLGGRTPFQHGS